MNEEARMSLWEAFSTLFLDTEVTDADVRYVARVIQDSGATLEKAEAVLWNEVFPILHPNLTSTMGEWAGWPRDWLKEKLRPTSGSARRPRYGWAATQIKQRWKLVLAILGSGT